MLLRDLFDKTRLPNAAWLAIGIGLLLLGTAGIVYAALVVVDAWLQFQGQAPILSHRGRRRGGGGIGALLIGGALVSLGWSEARAAWARR